MNRATLEDEVPDPELAELIDEDGPAWNQAWNRAFSKLHGIAERTVPTLLKKPDQDLVDHLFKESLRKVRKGLSSKRTSPDSEIDTSWERLCDFSGLRNMFVRIVTDTTKDYARKYNRECPYEDKLEYVSDEEKVTSDVEWHWALNTALSRVSPQYREILIGMFIKELDTYELMKIYGLTKGAVAGRTRLGKEELREIILNDYELCLILCPEEAKEKNKK